VHDISEMAKIEANRGIQWRGGKGLGIDYGLEGFSIRRLVGTSSRKDRNVRQPSVGKKRPRVSETRVTVCVYRNPRYFRGEE
jgi:hypothetical protein